MTMLLLVATIIYHGGSFIRISYDSFPSVQPKEEREYLEPTPRIAEEPEEVSGDCSTFTLNMEHLLPFCVQTSQ